jgi:flagellum-specific peptidoglycan hydrolase FlgJ
MMKRKFYIVIVVMAMVWQHGATLASTLFGVTSYRLYNSLELSSQALRDCSQEGFVEAGTSIVPDFEEYALRADAYLTRERFSHTAMTGQQLADAAEYTYHKLGIYVPLELALAQAQLESAFGTRGKSAETNPYNIGENDHGTTMHFKTLKAGIRGYYLVVAEDYLQHSSFEELQNNFVNGRNKRYATSTDYERKLRNQVRYIKKYVAKQLS